MIHLWKVDSHQHFQSKSSLACSERVGKAESNEERFKEGNSINKSLLTLGKVISHLADSSEERGLVSASLDIIEKKNHQDGHEEEEVYSTALSSM